MNEENLIKYYNKFNENKRLNTRHGNVEFITTMHYISKYLKEFSNPKIIEVGAGTGRYSIELSNQGYDVTAVELVKHNLRVIESKNSSVKVFQGNAIDLSKFNDNTYDMVLLFGPMYHLIDEADKIKALNEAKRVLKDDGIIMIAYCLSDYAIIKHGFMDGNIIKSIKNNTLDSNFNIISKDDDLYSYVRISDIDRYNNICNLKRVNLFTPTGPANYIRSSVNKLSEDEYMIFCDYVLHTCERLDMIGASSHAVDVLKKQ